MSIMQERVLSLIPHKPDGKFVHGAKADFATRWASISQDEQARNCAQVKAMSERGVGQLPNAK